MKASLTVALNSLSSDDKLRDRRGITQTEIEPLRADRRQDMRRFTDKRDPVADTAACGRNGERKYAVARINLQFSKN